MKFISVFAFLIAGAFSTNAQYYYSDIIGTQQTNKLYQLLRAFQYKQINATSFENGEPSKDFVLEQTISHDGSNIITRSATVGSTESYFTGYYENNKIVKTIDSSNNAINTVLYQYSTAGRVLSITSTSKDFDGTLINSEIHSWTYTSNGLPEKLIKVKNGSDTTLVTFTYEDESIAEERWQKNNRTIETYYYYYNPKKQITDIVRFNRKAKAMLPDYIFEYDEKGQLAQMTQTQNGTANYLVWKYSYNQNGIKDKEIVFNKQKELLGRIEYDYK